LIVHRFVLCPGRDCFKATDCLLKFQIGKHLPKVFSRVMVSVQNQPSPLSQPVSFRNRGFIESELLQFYRMNLYGSIQFSTTFFIHHLKSFNQ